MVDCLCPEANCKKMLLSVKGIINIETNSNCYKEFPMRHWVKDATDMEALPVMSCWLGAFKIFNIGPSPSSSSASCITVLYAIA